MPGNRQMTGMTYRIVSQDERNAEMEYTYYCPYCMRKATVRSAVPFPDYERLETGGFCETLMCSECGRAADIQFWKTMKID